MIRMIQEKDIEQCRLWYNWYITNTAISFEEEPVSAEDFKKRVQKVRKNYPWLVCIQEGKCVGYAYLDAFHPRAAYRWTCDLSIYVDPKDRHNGVGKELMEAILSLAKADGYKNVISLVTDENQVSCLFHEAFGFQKMVTFPNLGYKNGKWHHMNYYQRVLVTSFPDTTPEPPKNLDWEEEQ